MAIVKRLVAHIRQRWPKVQLLLCGDSHFSAPEVHDFCEQQDVSYILGQGDNPILKAKAARLLAQAQRVHQFQTARQPASESAAKIRLFTDFPYQAKSWKRPRRIISKVEVSDQGPNVRFVVTNLKHRRPQQLYELMYCGRGQMENFIKNHKTYLHSDRLSCHTFFANSFRLLLHSAAYILLQSLAHIGLPQTPWATAQFHTLQNRWIKVAVKVREMATGAYFS